MSSRPKGSSISIGVLVSAPLLRAIISRKLATRSSALFRPKQDHLILSRCRFVADFGEKQWTEVWGFVHHSVETAARKAPELDRADGFRGEKVAARGKTRRGGHPDRGNRGSPAVRPEGCGRPGGNPQPK